MNKHLQSGITLIEAMVALGVAAIVVMLSTNMSGVFQSGQMSSYVQDLVGTLQYARSEAIARSTRVTVCKKKAATDECDPAGSRWDNGWIVFVDENNDSTIVNPDVNILRIHGPVKGQFSIDSTSTLNNYASFIANGFPRKIPGDGGFLGGSLLICDQRGYDKYAKRIALAQTGRIRSGLATAIASTLDACPTS